MVTAGKAYATVSPMMKAGRSTFPATPICSAEVIDGVDPTTDIEARCMAGAVHVAPRLVSSRLTRQTSSLNAACESQVLRPQALRAYHSALAAEPIASSG